MDLLSGYNSSSSNSDNDDEKGSNNNTAAAVGQSSTPELVTHTQPTISLKRPLNSAPLPSVPLAVLRSQGVIKGNNSTSIVAANNSNNNLALSSAAIQGPAATHDPNDKVTSFVKAIDSKTGSTSAIEANAAVDEYGF